jgi:hypothetical protein
LNSDDARYNKRFDLLMDATYLDMSRKSLNAMNRAILFIIYCSAMGKIAMTMIGMRTLRRRRARRTIQSSLMRRRCACRCCCSALF